MSSSLTGVQLDRLAALVRTSTGLVFPPPRRGLLQRAAQQAMRAEAVADAEEYVRTLVADPGRIATLASQATVGETYLFRHPEQLDELRRVVIEPLVAERSSQPKPRIRVWSAGCSAGEEAYTLAILLAEAIPDLDRWDLRVVGTDLNPQALARARRGEYGGWSVRAPLGNRERWLERSADGIRVTAEIRDLVTFEQHNLATLPVVPRGLRGGPIDLIVCRNVMIYLDRSTVAHVLEGFHAALGEDGWLLVSPVESSTSGLRRRFAVWPGVAGGLHRRARARARASATGSTLRPLEVAAATPTPVEATPRRAERTPGRRPVRANTGLPVMLAAARSLADAGHLPAARDACVELLRRHPAAVDGYLLLASIAEAQHDLEGASQALRRVLYLDRENVIALFSLGLLDWRRGHTRRGKSRLQHAVELVEGRGDAAVGEPNEELSAERLRSVAGALLQ